MCTSMSLQNVTKISIFSLMMLACSTARDDFLLRTVGLKIFSIMLAKNREIDFEKL